MVDPSQKTEALTRTGDMLPWRSSVAPPPANLTKDELIAAMEAIAARSAARPMADLRSIDEIIGYDDFGLPLKDGDFAATDLRACL